MIKISQEEYEAFKEEVYQFIYAHSEDDCVDCAQLHEIDRYYDPTLETIRANREYNMTFGDFSDELYDILSELCDEERIEPIGGTLGLAINLSAGYCLELPIAGEVKPQKELSWYPMVFRAKAFIRG